MFFLKSSYQRGGTPIVYNVPLCLDYTIFLDYLKVAWSNGSGVAILEEA